MADLIKEKNKTFLPPKKSSFISILGFISILTAGFMIIGNISTLLMITSLTYVPTLQLAKQLMPGLSLSPEELVIEILLQIFGIVASVGMLKRLNWGRVTFMVVLIVMTIWGMTSSIISIISLSDFMNGFVAESSVIILVLGNVISVSIALYLVWKLSTPEIREEFLLR